MGYFSVYAMENPKDVIKLEMNEKDSRYQDLIEKFKNFFSGLEFKPLTQTKISICNVKQEFLKKIYSLDDRGCTTLDYNELLGFLNSIRIEGLLNEEIVPEKIVTPLKK